ncbi:MAG: MotA/TolQ/ExbB proton channel family protein [Deltaproteobacteria bacterium]|nr:MotA/TolQ/ExbB proton channel family protein [Deltaproteobacteria bacterium]
MEPALETTTNESHHLLSLIWHADPLVQLCLLILFLFSVVCWAIIIAKHRQLKKFTKHSQAFFEAFWNTKKMADIAPKRNAKESPAYQIFQVAKQSVEIHQGNGAKESITRDIRRAYEEEVEQVEYGVPFLATTASAAPFIGLFGTVWGILNAFWKIGAKGSTSLATVGPHIAEALIATAIGLAAAIPAVIFYNVFIGKIRRFSKDLEDFTEDLADRIFKEI